MTLESIEQAFVQLPEEYAIRKAVSANLAQEWIWLTNAWFDPRPLYLERMGDVPGRRLRAAPTDRNGKVCCGIDAQQRVIVEMEFNEYGCYETFHNWAASPMQSACYDYAPDKKAINLLFVQMRDGRAFSSECSATHGYTLEKYEWNGDRLVGVGKDHAKRAGGLLQPVAPLHLTKIEYDADGRVSRIVDEWPPSPITGSRGIAELVFERRGPKIFRRRP